MDLVTAIFSQGTCFYAVRACSRAAPPQCVWAAGMILLLTACGGGGSSSVVAGNSYYYRLQAISADSASDLSEEVSGTTASCFL